MTAFDKAVDRVRGGESAAEVAEELYGQLTDDERLGLLDGDTPFWPGMVEMVVRYNGTPIVHGEVARLGIPGTRFVDGPRGCVAGQATSFPVSMARGATWDVELEERVGRAIGTEVRAVGGNFFGGVCINLPRHPAWGRIQETYSDEPYQLGEMGAALTRGVQTWVMACAKHYALNSMENKRFEVDVTISEADLHETYLPHFKRCVDEDVAAIMSAYNSVNGDWAGQNRYLLTEVLRDQWGWNGITVSDFIWGLRDAARSLEAGLDLEEPFAQQRDEHLRDQLAAGQASWESVRRSGVRLIAAQLRSYATRTVAEPAEDLYAGEEHRALAQQVAERAMVLLRNDPVGGVPLLPLDPATLRTVVVAGRLADAPNQGDLGSSLVRPPTHVTPLAGISAALPGVDVLHLDTYDPAAVAAAAATADCVVLVVGFDERDEGEYVGGDTMSNPDLLALFPPQPSEVTLPEASGVMAEGFGGDRVSLGLRPSDEALIRATIEANPRTVVVLVGAGAIMMQNWSDEAAAIVMMWYAGMAGGTALGRILTGATNPSGRLPFAIPADPADLPDFDRDATAVTYGHLHGQRLIDSRRATAAFPHGWGMAYTQYALDAATVKAADPDAVTVAVTVRNLGPRAGHHVVQVYGSRVEGPYAGEQFVCGFAVADVPAGQSVTVPVHVSLLPVGLWNPVTRRVEPAPASAVVLRISSYAHDPDAIVLPLS
ncbi:MAG: glycoside hydrolase family 3 protein [Propionibacteriaceae bacterium]